MAVLSHTSDLSAPQQIRPLNPRRDLVQVADLIELCFDANLDRDGKRYLRRMRQAAENMNKRWLDAAAFQLSITAEGYVWEDKGRIVGNISLVPFTQTGRSIYLIANVAVHPEYRCHGIARALTEAGLAWAQRRSAADIWLQVRADNQAALHLYETAGFQPRARRTTWRIPPDKLAEQMHAGQTAPQARDRSCRIVSRHTRDWPAHRQWLLQNYPQELFWYWPVGVHAFRPGLWGMLVNFFHETKIRHWGLKCQGQLAGFLSWRKTSGYADQLWLTAPPENEDLVLITLLPNLHWRERRGRPLTLDYPEGRAIKSLTDSGFKAEYTLVWMSYGGPPDSP